MKDQILSVVRKTIKIEVDVKAGSQYLLNEIIEPKLDKIVNASTNPLDNIAKAALMPPLKEELIEMTAKANEFINAKIRKFLGYDDSAE